MSLLVFNLMATGLLLPLVLMDSLIDVSVYAHSSLEHGLCLASQSLTTLITSGSISAALVIAVDQYCAVMAPLHYHRRITKLRAWLLLAGQWLFASAMAALSFTDSAGKHFWKGCNLLPPAPVTDDVDALDIGNSSSTVAPAAANQTALSSVGVRDPLPSPVDVWSVLFVSLSVLCYVVPLALLTWMYVRIYSAAHRNSQRTRRTSLTHSASELVVHCLGSSQAINGSTPRIIQERQQQPSQPQQQTAADCINPNMLSPLSALNDSGLMRSTLGPSRTPSLRSTSSQIVHNLRYRISNASIFLYREEARAARVSVLVLVLVVFCWLPYHALLALQVWPPSAPQLPPYAYNLALVCVLINSLSSPFLYAYRSRRIQREVRRLFGLPPKSRKDRIKRMRPSKTLRSLSPRRQLLRKQAVRGSDALSPDEMQAALSLSGASSSRFGMDDSLAGSSAGERQTPQLMQTLLLKVTRLWHKPLRGTAPSGSGAGSVPNPPASCELMAVAADISRSSFSSATSTSSSAESDVSL